MTSSPVGVENVGQQKPITLFAARGAGHENRLTGRAALAHIVTAELARLVIDRCNDVESTYFFRWLGISSKVTETIGQTRTSLI